jgi:myo-inositol-1(or 4)-monophosphatase
MADFKEVAIAAAREAGAVLLEFSKSEVSYSMKNSHDIQAEADLEAERIIINKIRQHFPDHSILSEEAGEDEKSTEYLWVIDPVDGTINFSRHIEEYCISIALSRNGQIILGVIYQPALEKMFIAEKDKGAYLNGERLKVSANDKLINCLAGTDMISSELSARELNSKLFLEISPVVRHMRIFGSSALHMARLAQGQLDFYFKLHYNHWDYAAGTLIVQEAGGTVTDAGGKPIDRNSESILASNSAIHSDALAITSKYSG